MARRKTTRVTQKVLQQDRDTALAVLGLKDYNPANAEFTSDKLREALTIVEEVTAAETRAAEEAARARQAAINAEWVFHELVLGTKRQVIAQYGDDSQEITTLGLKRKSERRYGRPKKTAEGS
jgi:hypothetical protein